MPNAFAVIYSIALIELKKRYLGTKLGWVWAFLPPILTTIIVILVVQNGLNLQRNQAYVGHVVVGLLAWFYLSDCLNQGTTAIMDNAFMLKKVSVPIHYVVVARLVQVAIVHVGLIVVFYLFLLASGMATFDVKFFQIIYALICSTTLGFSFGLLLSTLAPFYRDITGMVPLGVQMLFWLTPIVWDPALLSSRWSLLLTANPFAYVMSVYRGALLGTSWAWSFPLQALIFWMIALMLCLLAVFVYRRCEPYLPDVV